MVLNITQHDAQQLIILEANAAKHIAAVNDIFSFEKEHAAARTGYADGAALCSAVSILSSEAGIRPGAAKAASWAMVRDWELSHVKLVEEMDIPERGDLGRYIEGLK